MGDRNQIPSREEARARSEPVLDSIPFVPRPEPDAQDDVASGTPDGVMGAVPRPKPKLTCAACQKLGLTLKRAEHKIMEDICEQPASSIPERCDRLGMAREEESVARRRLTNMGLVNCAGSVGNKRLIFQPTSKGREWARAHGISVPASHGDVIHDFVRRKFEEKLAHAVPGVRFIHKGTGEPGGVRPDSVALLPGKHGARLFLQVVVAHQPRGEATNLLKLSGASSKDGRLDDGVSDVRWNDLVVSVAINRRVQKSVEEAVKDLNDGQVPTNLIFLDAECLMDPAYDPTWILDRDM